MTDQRINEIYRQHKLTAAYYQGKFQGRVRQFKQELLAIEGTSIDEVLTHLRSFVDRRIDETAEGRTEQPSRTEYVLAFKSILDQLSESHMAMLKAHYSARNHELTAAQLAEAAGYSNYSAANLQYGLVGKYLHECLPTVLPKRADGSTIYTCAIASAGDMSTSDEGHWVWRMKPEVAEAVHELGLAN